MGLLKGIQSSSSPERRIRWFPVSVFLISLGLLFMFAYSLSQFAKSGRVQITVQSKADCPAVTCPELECPEPVSADHEQTSQVACDEQNSHSCPVCPTLESVACPEPSRTATPAAEDTQTGGPPCGTALAFDLSPQQVTAHTQDFEDYKREQARRSKGKEYPQQEMVAEDLQHLMHLLEHFSDSGLKKLQQVPMLELGARTGWGTEYMRSKGWQQALGLELSKEAVDFAKSKGRRVQKGDMHNLTPFAADCSQGLVFSRHSLEHTLDFNKVLREIYRVLRDRGFAYIVVPVEPYKHHELHTQPFYNDAQLIQGLRDAGFLIFDTELMITRMGPPVKERLNRPEEFLSLGYEQRVLAYKGEGDC
mmetsp:Transcript_32885/g.39812  ORF Transcript_32885/g.39812 Transcript_32885/m.39812 type:complete len:363 (+) Transcript_32885:298-1386(+)|eukprot:CAMPEP_0197863230 /NCGR_PEP_ID=MMETSP1438-20131217/40532_1 /TAXON_ID=1461541 /ORGANISM="Pterosperma sp., Strain CCMP1384" /LENGTH=362 /DNA_ID=CAMNT_0043481051 /DNA_START=292 /DNA_END=1380 /DNA_ORIENTATION=-